MTVVVLTLSGCAAASTTVDATSTSPVASASRTTAAAAASTTTAAVAVTTLPTVKVQTSESKSVSSIQKFADDVAAGKISTLTAQCWTVASQRIVQTYTQEGRATFLKAVGSAPAVGQYGLEWTSGATAVDVSWSELESSYACPHVSGGSSPAFPALMDASLLVTRIDGRIKGSPVNSKDTEKSYPLFCDTFDSTGGADAADESLTAAQKAAISRLATASGATFTAASATEGLLKVGSAATPALNVSLEADLCIDRIDT